MYLDPALTPCTGDAQRFNSQLGNLLRPAVDRPKRSQQNAGGSTSWQTSSWLEP